MISAILLACMVSMGPVRHELTVQRLHDVEQAQLQ